MICPDPTVSWFILRWLFNIFQAIGIVLTWEVMKRLWRLTDSKD